MISNKCGSNKAHRACSWNVLRQCDQMARLLFIIWLLTTTQICPKIIKIAMVGLKFCQTQNKPSKDFLKFAQVAKKSPNLVTLSWGSFFPVNYQGLDETRHERVSSVTRLPKFPTFLGIFCKGVKIFGQLLKTFGDYLLVTLRATQQRTKTRTKDRSDRSERKKEKRTQNVSAESKILKINGHLDRQTDKWRTDVSSGWQMGAD